MALYGAAFNSSYRSARKQMNSEMSRRRMNAINRRKKYPATFGGSAEMRPPGARRSSGAAVGRPLSPSNSRSGLNARTAARDYASAGTGSARVSAETFKNASYEPGGVFPKQTARRNPRGGPRRKVGRTLGTSGIDPRRQGVGAPIGRAGGPGRKWDTVSINSSGQKTYSGGGNAAVEEMAARRQAAENYLRSKGASTGGKVKRAGVMAGGGRGSVQAVERAATRETVQNAGRMQRLGSALKPTRGKVLIGAAIAGGAAFAAYKSGQRTSRDLNQSLGNPASQITSWTTYNRASRGY